MKYNKELHELTNELDDCYKNIFYSGNLENHYNFSPRLEILNYRIKQVRESQSNSRVKHDSNVDSHMMDKLNKSGESDIFKRAIKLKKAFNNDLTLPQLPSELWLIIAQYEGVVESCLLGQTEDSSQNTSNYSYCEIM